MGAVRVTVADPGAPRETAAMSGKDEAARDDRPVPRSPRRAWPAMVHRFRPAVSFPGVLPATDSFVISPELDGLAILRSGWVRCGERMFARGFRPHDAPSVPPHPVLAPAPPLTVDGVRGT